MSTELNESVVKTMVGKCTRLVDNAGPEDLVIAARYHFLTERFIDRFSPAWTEPYLEKLVTLAKVLREKAAQYNADIPDVSRHINLGITFGEIQIKNRRLMNKNTSVFESKGKPDNKEQP